jgi:hypothetical protein
MAEEAVTIETPSEAIERFVLEAMRPMLGSRVASSDMFGTYLDGCERQGLGPVSSARFGRLAGALWRKDGSAGACGISMRRLLGSGCKSRPSTAACPREHDPMEINRSRAARPTGKTQPCAPDKVTLAAPGARKSSIPSLLIRLPCSPLAAIPPGEI